MLRSTTARHVKPKSLGLRRRISPPPPPQPLPTHPRFLSFFLFALVHKNKIKSFKERGGGGGGGGGGKKRKNEEAIVSKIFFSLLGSEIKFVLIIVVVAR